MAGVLDKRDVAVDPASEPTLGELATRFVRTTVPRRLYQLLHLALPVAIDVALRGWWRTAGWSVAIAAFGAWGLADRWLADSAADYPQRARWVRGVRIVAGVLAVVPPIILMLEAFLRLLGDAPGH
ncbi:MAG TPA: hypothetical protein VFZ21_21040 [Gemmatimonadaceae bacterium]|jgi:hypothetical protein|nr:hypothetical protein [Gemmatimonadaceae bacterium]